MTDTLLPEVADTSAGDAVVERLLETQSPQRRMTAPTFTVEVDGKQFTGREGQTILDICRDNGIDVPTLCYEPKLPGFGACRMCVVEVEGEEHPPISCSRAAEPEMKIQTQTTRLREIRKTNLELIFSDHNAYCLPPCQNKCPSHIDIPGFLKANTEGNFMEAARIFKRTIPFPSVLGRVCPAPCEEHCRRDEVEEAIAIRDSHRYAGDHRDAEPNEVPSPALPAAVNLDEPRLPGHLERLADRARDYIEASSSANTRRAYASDWKHFAAWCRRQCIEALPPDPRVVGLYITACASGTVIGDRKPNSVSTIERRLSSLSWNYAQRGQPLERKDRHIATVLAGIRNTHAAPPRQKEAILPEELISMLETLDRGTLRGLRDRAMLLLGFAGGLRRSEIVRLDCGRDQTEDGRGWIEILNKGILVTLRGKTGWREVEIGRGSADATCPIVALETWLKFARIVHGPLFRRVTGQSKKVGADRLNDQEVARLVKRTALAAGVRGDLSEGQRAKLFSGHSLRAGLASSAEVDERYVQKQLGHSSAEMTRKYQRRRDRFRVNLTKAAGL